MVLFRLYKEEIAELCQFNSRINKNFNENFKRVFDLDEDLIDTIGRMRKENRVASSLTWQQYWWVTTAAVRRM